MTSHNYSRYDGSRIRAWLIQPAPRLRAIALKFRVVFLITLGAWSTGLMLDSPQASAMDGLPPGEPVPTWAAHKFVHFFPLAADRAAASKPESSLGGSLSGAGASPLLAGQGGEKLKYWGGPVQTEPQLDLLFWGNNFFNNTPPTTLYTQLKEFYYGLQGETDDPGEDSWQGMVTQYTNARGPYIKARVTGESKINSINAPTNVTEAQVLEEINTWVANGLQQNPNTQVIVLTPPGTTFSSGYQVYCAYHSVDSQGYSYSVVPYQVPECNLGAGELHETTGAASHEFAESVTDPMLSNNEVGWRESETNDQTEVADLCEQFPAQELPEENGRKGTWYAVKLWDDEGGNKCSIEDPPYPTPPVPSVTTEGAINIQYKQAAITGNLNPNGLDTHYHFEYGPTTGYGSSTSESDAGYGDSSLTEKSAITGLKPGTTYHYRLVASSWVGTSYGADKEFTTPIPPPVVKTEAPTEVGEVHVTLNAVVDPEEFNTTYQFEYWQNGKGGEVKKIPAIAESVGSGTSNVKVSQHLTGLPKSTEYIYRVTATNAGGTTKGKEVSFVTGPFLETQTTPNPSGGTENGFEGVSCSSVMACIGVGPYKNSAGKWGGLSESWNGTEWALKSLAVPSDGELPSLKSVSCTSATVCTGVGSYLTTSNLKSLAERWNGTEWIIQSTPNPSSIFNALKSVSCSSATSCVAVGQETNSENGDPSTFAEIWNGTEWKVQSTPSPSSFNSLSSVSCTSTTACTAVGTVGIFSTEVLVERWNGTEWSTQKGVNSGSSALRGVSCTSATACVAVGAGGSSSLVESWNGTSWATQTVPTPSGAKETTLLGISCSSSTSCIAAGSYINSSSTKVTLAEGWNGTEWQVVSTPNPSGAKASHLNAVSCPSAECVAVGSYQNSSEVADTLAEAGP